MRDVIEQLSYMSDNHGDNEAICYRNNMMTYKDLDIYSSKLATLLKDTSQPLVIYGHMSPFMIVGMIASIKAGIGYVPIDTSIPKERIEHIIDKVEPKYVFNTTEVLLDKKNIKQITVNECKEASINLEGTKQLKMTDIVYTIFTSGSTGLPKGVQITYDSLLDFTEWMLKLNQLGEGKKWLNQAPFSFDLSVMAIYPCLMSGGTLELVDKQMIEKPRDLYEMLNDRHIESWVSTPSFVEMCLLLPGFDDNTYPNLKQFFFCGEIFSHKTAQKLIEKYKEATVYNTYGPTEATVAVTSIQITQDILDSFNPLPVGKVREHSELKLADNGELIISGRSVSKGYLKDKEKNEKAFRIESDTRHYYTGDKAEYKEGYWFIQGRIDFQIKINGYRMELEEIELILERLPQVKQAVVSPIKKGEKVQYLYATVVLLEKSLESDMELIHKMKQELKQHLPEYMIPRKFKFTDHLPLTPNGKLNRNKVLEELES